MRFLVMQFCTGVKNSNRKIIFNVIFSWDFMKNQKNSWLIDYKCMLIIFHKNNPSFLFIAHLSRQMIDTP